MNNPSKENRLSMRKVVVLYLALFALISSASAQVFELDDNGDRTGATHEELSDLNIPIHLGNYDQAYAPIGSGVVLLAALGGTYLLGKKRKK